MLVLGACLSLAYHVGAYYGCPEKPGLYTPPWALLCVFGIFCQQGNCETFGGTKIWNVAVVVSMSSQSAHAHAQSERKRVIQLFSVRRCLVAKDAKTLHFVFLVVWCWI